MFSTTNKPVILAICGKSCTGKDTLAHKIVEDFNFYEFEDCGMIVSDTTRPPREGEVDGKDYNFLTREEFEKNIKDQKYLEYAEFRGWYYGTRKSSIHPEINIGVFNPQGIQSLYKYRDQYIIVPILLEAGFFTRLKRSIHREKKFKLEYLRRSLTDHEDFKYFDDIICRYLYSLTFNSEIISTTYITKEVIHYLYYEDLIDW